MFQLSTFLFSFSRLISVTQVKGHWCVWGSLCCLSPPPPSSSALLCGTGWASACSNWLSTLTFDLFAPRSKEEEKKAASEFLINVRKMSDFYNNLWLKIQAGRQVMGSHGKVLELCVRTGWSFYNTSEKPNLYNVKCVSCHTKSAWIWQFLNWNQKWSDQRIMSQSHAGLHCWSWLVFWPGFHSVSQVVVGVSFYSPFCLRLEDLGLGVILILWLFWQ